MMKRSATYQPSNGKKLKLDDDEIWGEDLDEEALDKCFELATQNNLFSSKTNNITVLPSYNSFKNPEGFTSSTQINITASTSEKLSLCELEAQIQNLRQQSEEKEGEICILRTKIKEANSVIYVEQQKSTNEWREKLYATEKEINAAKSELEFKNLEIVNLKQQLAEIRRHNLDGILNSTQQVIVPAAPVKINPERAPSSVRRQSVTESCPKDVLLELSYPLKFTYSTIYKNLVEEKHVRKATLCKLSRNTIPYLQNQQIYSESNFEHKCLRLGNKELNPEYVCLDIFKLLNSTSVELNGEKNSEAVNKIICVTLLMLQDFQDYLMKFGSYLRTEDIQQADTNYLLDDSEQCFNFSREIYEKDELGIKSGKMLLFLSGLLLYNKNVMEFVCCNKALILTIDTAEFHTFIPHRNGVIQNDFYLLNMLLDIVKKIGKYRKAPVVTGFLFSVTIVLKNIVISNNYTNVENVFCKLLQEIIFARPGVEVVHSITFILKICSPYTAFIKFLFDKNGKSPLEADSKGVSYYNEDACSFCVLSTLLQNTLLTVNKLALGSCINMIAFMDNTFKLSAWIHHENAKKVCVCLLRLYKLEIEFIFKTLEGFVEDFRRTNKKDDAWSEFLGVVQTVLDLMTFSNYELTEKYVMAYSQFKRIEKILNSEGQFNITQLNSDEELIRIPDKSFHIDF